MPVTSAASNHYTRKQMDALASRVGQTFWLAITDGKAPEIFAATTRAVRVSPAGNNSFEIIELVGRSTKTPWYKIKFASGREGFIEPNVFLEHLNFTILTVDPLAEEKKQAQIAETEDKERIRWINAQPWSPAVKEAAIKRQPVPGMNTGEIKRVIGEPTRIVKNQRTQRINGIAEERWFYPNGTILTFHNGMLLKSERKQD